MNYVPAKSNIIPLLAEKRIVLPRNVIEFIRQSKSRPLRIGLDSRRLRGIKNSDFISKELNVWQRILGSRKVTNLEIKYSDKFLEHYLATLVVHTIASSFDALSATYRLTLSPTEATPSTLALFRGLSFTQCQFNIRKVNEHVIKQVNQAAESARSFKFEKIGVQLFHADSIENLSRNISRVRLSVNPDYIYVGSESEQLTNEDFQQHTIFSSDINNSGQDMLSIGLGAISQFQEQQFVMVNDPRHYRAFIEREILAL